MPCYEWQCKACRELFEILCPSDQRELSQDCPHCGSRRTQRVYAPVRHYWNNDERLGLKGTGMTEADAMSITERAKKERGVMKP